MDDLTIVRRCADAMGLRIATVPPAMEKMGVWIPAWEGASAQITQYHPLTNDAQAMALVKHFGVDCNRAKVVGNWMASIDLPGRSFYEISPDLNRAICTAVATMQEAKG